MSREEAIAKLKEKRQIFIDEWADLDDIVEAFDMAIEALQEPKTIIGIDIPYGSDKGIATVFKGNEKMVLEEVKEIMSVVRCKDCIHWREDTDHTCRHHGGATPMCANDYCSMAERRE